MCESSHFYAGDFWLPVKKGRECQVHAPHGRSRAGDATDPGGAVALTLHSVRPTTQAWPNAHLARDARRVLTQESSVRQRQSSRCPGPLPRLKVPGVAELQLGPRGATGVDGTEPVACTAVSVLLASTGPGSGVLGFSCFCCTANSCRKSGQGKGVGLRPCFGGRGGGQCRHLPSKRHTRVRNFRRTPEPSGTTGPC